jgi:ribonuclease BN (tRNA processing enzyme)
MGYRIESRGKVLVYATDLEHGHLELDGVLRQFSEGADILFFDSMYTPQDYEEYRGWGHSTWLEATRVARDAGVDRVILYHHNPNYDDARLDAIEQEAKEHFSGALMAREGTTLIL